MHCQIIACMTPASIKISYELHDYNIEHYHPEIENKHIGGKYFFFYYFRNTQKDPFKKYYILCCEEVKFSTGCRERCCTVLSETDDSFLLYNWCKSDIL